MKRDSDADHGLPDIEAYTGRGSLRDTTGVGSRAARNRFKILSIRTPSIV